MRQRTRRGWAVAALLISGSFVMTQAGVGAETINGYSIDALRGRYDISGIKLGMSFDQVAGAIKNSGFGMSDSHSNMTFTQDWSTLVDHEVAKRQSRAPHADNPAVLFLHLDGPRGQAIEVDFAASPQGQIVKRVRYSIPTSQITEDAFNKQAAEKWGASRRSSPLYCFEREPECGGGMSNYLPYVSSSANDMKIERANDGPTFHLTLHEGQYLMGLREKQLASAVEAGAPRDAKAGF